MRLQIIFESAKGCGKMRTCTWTGCGIHILECIYYHGSCNDKCETTSTTFL